MPNLTPLLFDASQGAFFPRGFGSLREHNFADNWNKLHAFGRSLSGRFLERYWVVKDVEMRDKRKPLKHRLAIRMSPFVLKTVSEHGFELPIPPCIPTNYKNLYKILNDRSQYSSHLEALLDEIPNKERGTRKNMMAM